MPAKFVIYTTDANPITVPESASSMVKLDDPPWAGDYDNFGDATGRGSVHRTLGGVVVQDFGVLDSDRTIKIAGTDALRTSTVTLIDTMYRLKDAVYIFTDGYEFYRVRFSRNPAGFRYWRNLKFAEKARSYYSYEINLIVVERVA